MTKISLKQPQWVFQPHPRGTIVFSPYLICLGKLLWIYFRGILLRQIHAHVSGFLVWLARQLVGFLLLLFLVGCSELGLFKLFLSITYLLMLHDCNLPCKRKKYDYLCTKVLRLRWVESRRVRPVPVNPSSEKHGLVRFCPNLIHGLRDA